MQYNTLLWLHTRPCVSHYEFNRHLSTSRTIMVPVPTNEEMLQADIGGLDAAVVESTVRFLFDAKDHRLTKPGVVVGISAMINSPFLQPQGARQLVSFLNSLPHRSLLLICDSIQQHSIMAVRGKKQRNMTMERALEIALQRGDLYVNAISKAVKENNIACGSSKITLVRWDDIINESKLEQEIILHRHFLDNKLFRDRVEQVAELYINERKPQSHMFLERKMHTVNFILSELGGLITGMSHQEERYQTVVYATSDKLFAKTEANAPGSVFTLVHDILTNPAFANLKNELVHVDGHNEVTHGCLVLALPEGRTAHLEPNDI